MEKFLIGKEYQLIGNSKYLLEKYGTSNPIARLDNKLLVPQSPLYDKIEWTLWFSKNIMQLGITPALYYNRHKSDKLFLHGIFYYSHIEDKDRHLHGELIHEQEIGESINRKKNRCRTHNYKVGKLKYGNIFIGFCEYKCPFCQELISFTPNYVNIRTFILDSKRIPYICPFCKNLMILDTIRHKLIKKPQKESLLDVVKMMKKFNKVVKYHYNLQEIKNYKIE